MLTGPDGEKNRAAVIAVAVHAKKLIYAFSPISKHGKHMTPENAQHYLDGLLLQAVFADKIGLGLNYCLKFSHENFLKAFDYLCSRADIADNLGSSLSSFVVLPAIACGPAAKQNEKELIAQGKHGKKLGNCIRMFFGTGLMYAPHGQANFERLMAVAEFADKLEQGFSWVRRKTFQQANHEWQRLFNLLIPQVAHADKLGLAMFWIYLDNREWTADHFQKFWERLTHADHINFADKISEGDYELFRAGLLNGAEGERNRDLLFKYMKFVDKLSKVLSMLTAAKLMSAEKSQQNFAKLIEFYPYLPIIFYKLKRKHAIRKLTQEVFDKIMSNISLDQTWMPRTAPNVLLRVKQSLILPRSVVLNIATFFSMPEKVFEHRGIAEGVYKTIHNRLNNQPKVEDVKSNDKENILLNESKGSGKKPEKREILYFHLLNHQ